MTFVKQTVFPSENASAEYPAGSNQTESTASLLKQSSGCQGRFGIVNTDFSNKITDMNDAFVRMLGYEQKQELVGRNLPELCAAAGSHICSTGDPIILDEQYQRQQVQYTSRLIQSGCSSGRVYLYRRDGIVIPADVTATVLTDDAGGRTGMMTVFVDAAERLQAEQQREQTNFFMNIFTAARDGIYVSDGLGKCILANQAFCDMTGYSRQELIGPSAFSLLPETLDSAATRQILQTMRTNEDMSLFETVWQHKSGAVLPVEVCLAVLKDARGEDNGIVATVRNISQRLKAEKETQAEKAFLENVFIHASEGMYVTDALGCFILVNQAFCEMTGYAQEELMGRYAPSALPFAPDFEIEEIDNLNSRQDFSCFESRWLKKDGTLFSVEVRLAELQGPQGEVNGLVGIVCDTTARRLIEQELEDRVHERTASLEDMNKALTVLLRVREEDKKAFEEKISASFSGLVLPYLEKLKASPLSERQRTSLSIIEANLESIIAPFAQKTAITHNALTPGELQIANLIRQGFKTKDIARITGLSCRTIDHARESIRNKLGITDRKISLSAYLCSSG